jgi:enamine deaminase RidA (YjgF/YER057c/UK114 family)
MPRHVLLTDRLMRPIAHFAHASRIETLVHVGAAAGVYPDLRLAGDSVGRVDVVAQTRRMFDNLETELKLVGASLSDVVRLKAYVADVRDIARYSELYAERFASIRPAHTVVGSWAFPLPQAAVELDAVAVIGGHAEVLESAAVAACPGCAPAGVLVDGFHYATSLPVGAEQEAAPRSINDQISATLRNLGAMLTAAGLSPRDVCNIHVTVADIRDLADLEIALMQFFDRSLPTVTVVGAPLERAEFLLALESIAVKGGGQPVSCKLAPALAGKPMPAMIAGDTLFLSGQMGLSDESPDDAGIEQQTGAAWDKLHGLIDAAGFDPDSLLRTNNILTNWRDYAGFNAGYGANMAPPYVPRATVLGCLPSRRARVQIEGIAHRRGADATILQVAPPGITGGIAEQTEAKR